ncbi:MAG: hypothetical protein AB1642_05735, partial [Pseudomonadota bacterium]
MTLKLKLGIGFAGVALLFIATLLLVGASLSRLMQNIEQIDRETLPFILVVDEMDTRRVEVQNALTDASATHNRDSVGEADEFGKQFLDGVGKFRQMFQRENDAASLKQLDAIEADFLRFLATGKKMVEAYIAQGVDAGNVIMEAFDKDSDQLSEKLEKFRGQQIDEARHIAATTLEGSQATLRMMLIGGAVSALLAIVLALWITRNIMAQLGGDPAFVSDIIREFSDGHLGVKIDVAKNDSTSMLAAIKGMATKLSSIISEVNVASDALNNAAGQVSATAQSLSQSSSEQAASVEETT